jgi:hypothetical protein
LGTVNIVTAALIAGVVEDIGFCPFVAFGSAFDAESASVVGSLSVNDLFEGEAGREFH